MSTWNILVVDTSASMTSNIDSVNKGIVDLFVEQKDNIDRFTFLTFNTDIHCAIDRHFNEIECETVIKYIVNKGLTALYDAVGHVYEMIISGCAENVNVTIITDGFENSSKIHTLASLKTLRETIDKMCNITVTFICENKNIMDNNTAIISHANESCEVSGDYSLAFRVASRTMSGILPPSRCMNYISDENNVSVSEPIVKRQTTYDSKKKPRLFF